MWISVGCSPGRDQPEAIQSASVRNADGAYLLRNAAMSSSATSSGKMTPPASLKVSQNIRRMLRWCSIDESVCICVCAVHCSKSLYWSITEITAGQPAVCLIKGMNVLVGLFGKKGKYFRFSIYNDSGLSRTWRYFLTSCLSTRLFSWHFCVSLLIINVNKTFRRFDWALLQPGKDVVY